VAVRKVYLTSPTPTTGRAAIAATSFVPDDVVAELCDALGLIGRRGNARNG